MGVAGSLVPRRKPKLKTFLYDLAVILLPMAEYAKTSEITPLIGVSGDLDILENMTGEKKVDSIEPQRESSFWKDTNARQKCLLLFVILGQLTTCVCASLPTPFLARLITERGGHVIASTAIVQVTIFMMACSSVIFGKYQALIGSKTLLILGITSFGICHSLFGLLSYVSNIHVFVAAGIVIRAIQGIGHGAYAVASLTLICQEFTDHIGKIFGITESAVGVGYLTGPMLGSVLYSITDGILFPFVASGTALLLMVPIALITIKKNIKEGHADSDSINAMDCVGDSGCILVLGLALAIYGGYGIFDVTVTIFLQSKSFTVVEVGTVLFVCGLSYCFTSVIIGFVSGLGISIRRTIIVLGLVGFPASTFMFSANQSKQWVYVGSSFFGIFGGFTLIGCFTELLNLVFSKNIADKTNFSLHSTLSGIWNFVFGMGTFIYPLFGSEIEKFVPFGFSMLTLVIGGYCLAIMLSMIAKCTVWCTKSSNISKPYS